MSKFIEVTRAIITVMDTVKEGQKALLNTTFIRRVEKGRGYTALYLSNKEDMVVCETYDEIKALIQFDPAVADIVIKGESND